MPDPYQLPIVGIDDISVYIPGLCLDIDDLARARGIDPAKMRKGLGLSAMSIPDASEDVVTMAAEALLQLVDRHQLKPGEIGRVYVGTESMVDGSKPIASYLLGILERYYKQQQINTTDLRNTDAVDLTFACIGAVDALQNTLDWIRLNPGKKAVIVSTDWAKYDLGSPGESTQGAGAIALLVSADPGLIAIDRTWGVSAKCEHDFYKPLRPSVRQEDKARSNGVAANLLGREIFRLHKDTPVYDGQFSNMCYADRISEAFDHFQDEAGTMDAPLETWKRLVFHLPYAYHARRVFPSIFIEELRKKGTWISLAEELGVNPDPRDPDEIKAVTRTVSKSPAYLAFVNEKIAPGEKASSLVGNLYTGSIFLSLVSTLLEGKEEDFAGSHFGFFAYGSGSKSKVFQGKVMPGYQARVGQWDLAERLENRIRIDISRYEYLHREKLLVNLDSRGRRVFQASSGWTTTNRFARNYSIFSPSET